MCPSCKQPLTGTRIFRFHSTLPEKAPASAAPPPAVPARSSNLRGLGFFCLILGAALGIGAAILIWTGAREVGRATAAGAGVCLVAGLVLSLLGPAPPQPTTP
jgi:hypothetical protein